MNKFYTLINDKMQKRDDFVILSERSESKDLGTDFTAMVIVVRRSFDYGLRPPLRMTDYISIFN